MEQGTQQLGDGVTAKRTEWGSHRLDLWVEGQSVSRLHIHPMTIRIGQCKVRMDGIGGVGTDEDCRYKGYSRRVLEAAVKFMIGGDGALSMLYGIRDFYPKFGYATAGPAHYIHLHELDRPTELPKGWTARDFVPGDLPALHNLYRTGTGKAVGALVRTEGGSPWRRLQELSVQEGRTDCRVVVNPKGAVDAYAWRGMDFWFAQQYSREHPDEMIVSEVMARDARAADALLSACRLWAQDEIAVGAAFRAVTLGAPPEGPVAQAARRDEASLVCRCFPCSDSMARVLSPERLLTALAPELSTRLRSAVDRPQGIVTLKTDLGDVALTASEAGIRVGDPDDLESSDLGVVELPQYELARLALGAFEPKDLLSRLPTPPAGDALKLLATLFPQRHPHMWMPDRY
jgi:predicted acetyltransferase